MIDSLSEDYFCWLVPQVRDRGKDPREFGQLFFIMYETEFSWSVPNDDNRVADGLDLRVEFCRSMDIPTGTMTWPCSFLEALIALSRRLAFVAGGPAESWAWQLVTNLKLDQMSDPLTSSRARRIDHILDVCINRKYRRNGHGGFFPLMHAREDQTKVELWYQMAAYVDELNPG